LNIVHVVESLDRGGLERVACDLSTEQARKGHRVGIACLFSGGLLAEELRHAGVTVDVVHKRSGLDLRALLRLRRALRAARPDIVHTHNATAHYHAVLALSGDGRPVIVSTRHGMGGSRTRDRRERLFSLALRRTAAVVAVCRAAATRLVGDGIVTEKYMRVVPNGIRLDQFDGHACAEARSTLGLPADALVVGTVGRLNWAKDHALLLHAFNQLRARVPTAILVVVGGGEERDTLMALAHGLGVSEFVRFTGDRPDVPRLLPAFDIFAISSRTEGYSIALLEACAAGLPTVATNVGGNGEIVQDGVTGVLVECGSAEALSGALVRLASSSSLRREMGAKARQWAERNASLAVMAERYERIYSEFEASRSRPGPRTASVR
jgi:glycosyltransferase involved in cell wall biosynthesis